MGSQYDLIWDGEKPGVPSALAKVIPDLRKKTQEGRVRALKIMLSVKENIDLALVIISDDPSKLSLVQHVPTDMLYALGCINMIRARQKQSDILQRESKEESAAIQIVVDRQMAEIRTQLDRSIKTQINMQAKLDGLNGVLADMGSAASSRHTESIGMIDKVIATIAALSSEMMKMFGFFPKIKETVSTTDFNLRQLIRDAGGHVASDVIGSHRFIPGR